MFWSIRRVYDEHIDVKVIYPIYMNPVVRKPANEILGGNERIRIIEPLDVLDFHNFLANSHMILTDSGGSKRRYHCWESRFLLCVIGAITERVPL